MARTILSTHAAIAHGDTTVTGGDTASDSMAIENVLSVQPSEFTRFIDNNPANTYFVVSPGVLLTTDFPVVVFVGYSNVSNTATIRLRSATFESDLVSSPAYDTGAVNFWHDPSIGRGATLSSLQDPEFPRGGHHVFYVAAANVRRKWRIDIDDQANNPDGYVDVGVVSIGRAFEATNPIGNGWSFGASPMWVGQTSMGGQRYRRSVASPITLEATWQMTSQSDANNLHNIVRKNAEAKAVLCVIDVEDNFGIMNNTAWGHMTATQPIAVPYHGLWQTTLRVEEMP